MRAQRITYKNYSELKMIKKEFNRVVRIWEQNLC